MKEVVNAYFDPFLNTYKNKKEQNPERSKPFGACFASPLGIHVTKVKSKKAVGRAAVGLRWDGL